MIVYNFVDKKVHFFTNYQIGMKKNAYLCSRISVSYLII
jgi:hypothetical protein